MTNSALAFALTLAAGLATGIGCFFSFQRISAKYLAAILGFAAGVMVYIALFDVFPDAQETLRGSLTDSHGPVAAVLAFAAGLLLVGIFDRLFPHTGCAHTADHELSGQRCSDSMLRTGLFAALAFGIHNFPEGAATFLTILENPAAGSLLAVSVALHNIPAGIAISIPVYTATKSKSKTVCFALAVGMVAPLGALCGYFFLLPATNAAFFGFLLAAAAGIMVYIAVRELLPEARRWHFSLAWTGFFGGFALLWAIHLFLH